MSKTGITWPGEKPMPTGGVRTSLTDARRNRPSGNIAVSTLGG
jgi:hypothetical protein